MRKLLLASLSVLALATTALPSGAADLPAARPVYKAPAYVPFNPWAGFYLGANVGYGWERFGHGDSPRATTGDVNYGVQGGYNWLVSNWLIGLEADLQATSGRFATATGTCAGIACTVDGKINGFGTVRGRLGTIVGKTLLYATGGASFIDIGAGLTAAGGLAVNQASWRTGYAVGGGVEQMLWDRWSGKLEYLYISANGPSLTSGAVTQSIDARAHIVRAGLNYHF